MRTPAERLPFGMLSTKSSFLSEYQNLEQRMRELAEADRTAFFPSPEPTGPVDHIFICMEPSCGGHSANEVRAQVDAGARNFLSSIEDFILHFSIRRYLCKPGQRYHVTDVSKGAMLVRDAAKDRERRYFRWYPLLVEEIDLIANSDARVFAVGKAVSDFLGQQPFPRPYARVLHYSPQAARARNAAIEGREERFETFRDSVTLEDLVSTARDVLEESQVPNGLLDGTVARLRNRVLTPSRKKLIFSYMVAFEAVQL